MPRTKGIGIKRKVAKSKTQPHELRPRKGTHSTGKAQIVLIDESRRDDDVNVKRLGKKLARAPKKAAVETPATAGSSTLVP